MIVLNVHAPTEDKIDNTKDSVYVELDHVFNKFPKYHTKMLLGDVNGKVGREDIFKPTTGNNSLHKTSTDNGVRVVNFDTYKNLSKVKCSHIIQFKNLHGHLLMERLTIKLTSFHSQ
jgi:hypothetical protein